MTFAGTEFTTSGLVNGDTVTGVTLTSAGAAATATVAGSPYDIDAAARRGHGAGQLHDHLRQRHADGQPGGPDGDAPATQSKTYGRTVTLHGTDVHDRSGLVNGDTVTSVTLTSAGAAATATVAGAPYDIVPSAAVGTGLATTRSPTTNGTLTVNPKAPGR